MSTKTQTTCRPAQILYFLEDGTVTRTPWATEGETDADDEEIEEVAEASEEPSQGEETKSTDVTDLPWLASEVEVDEDISGQFFQLDLSTLPEEAEVDGSDVEELDPEGEAEVESEIASETESNADLTTTDSKEDFRRRANDRRSNVNCGKSLNFSAKNQRKSESSEGAEGERTQIEELPGESATNPQAVDDFPKHDSRAGLTNCFFQAMDEAMNQACNFDAMAQDFASMVTLKPTKIPPPATFSEASTPVSASSFATPTSSSPLSAQSQSTSLSTSSSPTAGLRTKTPRILPSASLMAMSSHGEAGNFSKLRNFRTDTANKISIAHRRNFSVRQSDKALGDGTSIHSPATASTGETTSSNSNSTSTASLNSSNLRNSVGVSSSTSASTNLTFGNPTLPKSDATFSKSISSKSSPAGAVSNSGVPNVSTSPATSKISGAPVFCAPSIAITQAPDIDEANTCLLGSEQALEHYRTYLTSMATEGKGKRREAWAEAALFGQQLFATGRPNPARQIFQKILEESPDESFPYTMYGSMLLAMGDEESAATLYNRALQLVPTDVCALLGRAELSLRDARPSDAMADVQLAIIQARMERSPLESRAKAMLAVVQKLIRFLG